MAQVNRSVLQRAHARLVRHLVAALALLVWPSASYAFDPPVFVKAWGSAGGTPGHFSAPRGMAADPSSGIYVADTGNDVIQKFDSTGAFLLGWGTFGQFNAPVDIAVGQSGNVYVADLNKGTVDVFSSGGAALFSFGQSGALQGPGGTFDLGPNGIACGQSGQVYVSDPGNARIQEFDASGTFIRMWGSSGQGNGQFQIPGAIAVGPDGTVYVADEGSLNYDVQAFDAGGTFIRKWGGPGTGAGQFRLPKGIGTDASGNVYVADGENDRVQVFTSAGAYLGAWGASGTGNGQFNTPEAIAVIGNFVYVLDSGNDRVQEFTITPVAALPTSWGRLKSMYH